MRKDMEAIVKRKLREYVIAERYRRGLVQERMASAFLMSPRSYADIERGKGSCGVLSTLLFLMSLEDPAPFLQQLRGEMEKLLGKDEQTA